MRSSIIRCFVTCPQGPCISPRCFASGAVRDFQPDPQPCLLCVSELFRRLTNASGVNGWGDRWLEGPVVDALPEFLSLAQELLVTQWHCFVPPAVRRRLADRFVFSASMPLDRVASRTLPGCRLFSSHSDVLMTLRMLERDWRGVLRYG